MSLLRYVNKLYLISKWLESLDKMMKSLEFMLQSQVIKLSELLADCLTF